MNNKTDIHLYILNRGDKPIAYRCGEEWVAMQLLVEGGFKTPITAWLSWVMNGENQND